jgi:hypothetical protein
MQKAIERKTVREALGDEAAPGTPGTGENVCPACKGSKEIDEVPCLYCAGTGIVIEGIGGG